MKGGMAPLASIEDLSDIEYVEGGGQCGPSNRQSKSRSSHKNSSPRSGSDGICSPACSSFENDSGSARQSVSDALLISPDRNYAESIQDKTARHHMVLVHMKPQRNANVQTYLVTPVQSASCLSAESSGVFCRICHEGDGKEELISPCKCAGTMGLIHVSCVEKWLSQAGISKCEICGFEYKTERTPRSISEWLKEPSRPNDARNFYGDLACFVLLTPLASVSTWLCLSGAIHYSKFEKTMWETAGLVTLAAFLILIYFVWCMVALRYHVRVIQDWRKSNQVVKIRARREKAADSQSVDGNNNCASSCFVSSSRTQAYTVNEMRTSPSSVSPPNHISSRRSSVTRRSLTSLNSPVRNLSSELMTDSPVAASSPIHIENSAFPDILEGSPTACSPSRHIRFSSDVNWEHPNKPEDSRARNVTSFVCSGRGQNSCKGILYQTFVPLPWPSRTVGGFSHSRSLPRSLESTQETKDLPHGANYVRARSSFSESACADYKPNESGNSCKASPSHVVKETYV